MLDTGCRMQVILAKEVLLESQLIPRFLQNIPYPVTSIQHPVTSIQYPVSSIQHPEKKSPPKDEDQNLINYL
jgi:hypothetical protein